MLIIAGWLRLDPSARSDYLDSCAAVVTQARAAPGCLDFALTADLLDPGRINVYERWESDEQLLAFRGSGPPDAQTAHIRDADVRKYRVSAVEAA
ncbi:putative quinol monooxygenase [Pseudonocardia sp. DLS-67]